jgi:hypothetical protein
MRASTRMPMVAVAYRRTNETPARSAASTSSTARSSSSSVRSSGTMASSIARCTTTGSASDSRV